MAKSATLTVSNMATASPCCARRRDFPLHLLNFVYGGGRVRRDGRGQSSRELQKVKLMHFDGQIPRFLKGHAEGGFVLCCCGR
jgi:hypothetical protein